MALMKARKLKPVDRNTMLYSVVIPAYNESENIIPTAEAIVSELRKEEIPFELVVINDNSTDLTPAVIAKAKERFPEIKLIDNTPPGGFGRAVRLGLDNASGEAIAVVMADLSDSPQDMVRYYRKLEEGYDSVFGSRFIKGGKVTAFPKVKLVMNRLMNNLMRVMFLTHHNDLTNAFKAYRRHVVESIKPLRAAHFNITIEISLSILIRHYNIAQIPISWSGRTWGSSNLKLREMGRRYFCTMLKIWFERLLILDDLMDEVKVDE